MPEYWDPDDVVADIERRRGGSLESEDVTTLRGKHPEDRAAYVADLDAKQARRMTSTGDRPFDSQSDHYDQRTNALSAKGTAELARRGVPGQTGDPRRSAWPVAPASRSLTALRPDGPPPPTSRTLTPPLAAPTRVRRTGGSLFRPTTRY